MPGGARFYRCALQVNPYDYLIRHAKKTAFGAESDYNEAIIRACMDNGIEVIAVTDHYRVKTSVALWEAARAAGLHVLPGFEAVTKEGIHLLCLFDPDKTVDALERVLGACGIHGNDPASPIGQHDVIEFLEESRKWGAACIAAHAPSEGGLLATLKGQARINAWRSPLLQACSLPGPVSGAPDNVRKILQNKDPSHRRDQPIAILNAQDVSDPKDVSKAGTSCWIKSSEISVEGLRQAFLDPDSRIRLASDSVPEEHTEFVAMAWEGGFLDGATLRFNENLNVIIGGRGAGKSTVVESVRHVLNLEPLGDEARKAHQGIVRHVLRGGTKISLLVRSHHPAMREYLIERAIPNPPVVRDEAGTVLDLTPSDVIPQAEVYGQHEISELARSPEKLTLLLERFVQREPDLDRRKGDVDRELNRSRSSVLEIRRELKDIEERLAALPGLEEKLRRFEEAGLEDKLKDQSLLVSEERVLRTAGDRVTPFRELLERLRQDLPIDRDFLSSSELKELPRKEVLERADPTIERLNQDLTDVADRLQQALERAEQGLGTVRTDWETLKESVRADYERILRELQKTKLDGTEFIQLRSQIEELQPLKEKESELRRDLKDQENHRRTLLASWEDLKSEDFRHLDRAVQKVNRQLVS